jgi:hypothetical protein
MRNSQFVGSFRAPCWRSKEMKLMANLSVIYIIYSQGVSP